MPPIQLYTNHARKCVRSRSGTHGKISQHNSRQKLKSYKLYITSQGPRGVEYISSNTNESAETKISEYIRKLNKICLKKASTKVTRSKRQGLLPGSLLTTPGRLRSPCSSRHPRGSSSRQWWRLAPGIHHLVATIGYRGKIGSKATVSTHPNYPQDLHQI